MREGKRDFGLFFTDASFDHKSRTAVIGIINVDNSKTYSYSIKAKGPQEAEEYGIEKVIQIAQQEKIFNLIVFCDNKYSVQQYTKKFSNPEFSKIFWKIQFVWLPREYNQIADMLSKNISEKDVGALQKIKEENLNKRTTAIDKKISTKYIKEIEINKENTASSLLLRITQFKALYEATFPKRESNSEMIQEFLSENISFSKIENMIIESDHIDALENEINYLSARDVYVGAILKSIRDAIIFF